jgi:UDP-N-acetylmuramyl pentapeptide phosphotransferase/UDP-N-acetylglucosamine-1-phosphate transferase
LFLGDNGSYTVAVFLVYGVADAADADSPWSLLAVAGVLGVFVVDLVATLVRRRMLGYPTFGGDRNHLYDQLHRRGLSVWRVTATMTGAQVVLVGIVVACDALLGDIVTVVVMASVLVGTVAALGALGFLGRQGSGGPAAPTAPGDSG